MSSWHIDDVADVHVWNRGVRVIGLGDDVAMAPSEAVLFASALLEAVNRIVRDDEDGKLLGDS